jgi:DHA2 family lincomycin resistance protein-like MFS transporter
MLKEGQNVGTASASVEMTDTQRTRIVVALIIGAFLAVLNETMIQVAFPDLMKDFSAPLMTVQWLATVYMLVVGTLVPVTALLQMWFTTRQMFLSATIFFLVGTIVCGAAPVFPVLWIGRALQALGTGIMLPVMMNTMMNIFPPERRGSAMGMIGLVVMFAPAIGPTIAGLIIDWLSWRWMFYLIIPIAAFSVLFAAAYLRNVSEITKPKVDHLSIGLSCIGFGGFVYGLSAAATNLSSETALVSLLVGAAALVLFVLRQLSIAAPILELRTFRYPMFRIAMVLVLLLMSVMFSAGLLLSQFMLIVLGMTAFEVGLCGLLPGTVYAAMSLISGKLFDRYSVKVLIVPGFMLVLLSLWAFTWLDQDTTAIYIIAMNVLLSIGIPLVMTPVQTAGLNALPRTLFPHGAAIVNTLMQIAGAIGIVTFTGIVSKESNDYLESLGNPATLSDQLHGFNVGIQSAFWWALAVGAAALVVSLFIKRAEPPEQA